MRYYKIELGPHPALIGPEALPGARNGKLIIESGPTNRTPLNVSFEIAAFSEGAAAVPGFISLYNPSTDFFTKATKLCSTYKRAGSKNVPIKGCPIKFSAGTELFSAYDARLGISTIYNRLLFTGYINNVLGDFSSHTPKMNFYFMVDQPQTKTDREDEQSRTKAELQIPPQSKIFSVVENFVKSVSGFLTDWHLTALPSVAALTNPSPATIVLAASSIIELLMELKKSFGIYHAFNAKDKEIILDTKENRGASLASTGLVKRITPADLLSQPEMIEGGAGQSITFTLRLRADLGINDAILLTGAMPQLSGIMGTWMPSQITAKELFTLGLFKITELHHVGDYYNSEAEGWSTQVVAVRAGKFS